MPVAITTPRINNNDDDVRFSQIHSPAGSPVKAGDPIAEIETDKATFTIEAEQDGYVLGFVHEVGELISVGSVLAWLGSSPDEHIPVAGSYPAGTVTTQDVTLKAAVLLAKFGISAGEVPSSGERLTAQDVLDYVSSRRNGRARLEGTAEEGLTAYSPVEAGTSTPLTPDRRAMLKGVLWQKHNAATGYVEIEYDVAEWDAHARAYQQQHNLLLSPLLALMAWRLTRLAEENPKINCTIVGDHLHQYSVVNLGFTLESDGRLSLLCVRDAAALTASEFVARLTSLMRQAMRNKLKPEDTTNATVSFSSMARWQVARHIPILPPFTSLIVAHAHPRGGIATLGATYDHRVLTGGEVAVVLRSLSVRPDRVT